MGLTFRALLWGSLRDRISLGWAVAFPVLLMLALSVAFEDAAYRARLLAGTLVISGVFFAVHGTAFEVLSQRNRGVYKLLRVTPFVTTRFIVSLALVCGLLATLCTLLVLAFGLLFLALAVITFRRDAEAPSRVRFSDLKAALKKG